MTLNQIRSDLAQIKADRVRLRRKTEDIYTRIANDPQNESVAGLKAEIEQLRGESTQLRNRATDGIARELDPRQFVTQLDGEIPLLLMPLRVQTRFQTTPEDRMLLIRVYPDDISVERHEPRLSASERTTGESFWAAAAEDQKAIWRGIVTRFNLRRAAWVIKATNPAAPQPVDPLESPLLVPAAWTLPERLIFRLYGESDRLIIELPGAPIPDGLEMGLDPTRDDLGFNRDNGNLNYPDELRWQTDFNEAVKCGMGVEVSLGQLGNPSKIDRIMVVGVKLGTDEKQSALMLERLIESHRYTEGFSIVPQGTPTNITTDADVPLQPDVDATLARLIGPGAYEGDGSSILYEDECDGLRLAHALGISPEILSHVDHAGQEDGREAIAMKRALWAGTLGYYAQQMLAPLLESLEDSNRPEEVILTSRFFFTNFVFARGPLPAFRVGSQPYGILPISADVLRSTPNVMEPWGDGKIDFFMFQLHEKLAALAPKWIQLTDKIHRAGAGVNANARLLDVLALQASSVEWHTERLVGPDYLKYYTDFKNQDIGIGNDTPYNRYISQLNERFNVANAEFPDLFPLIPRVFMLSFLGAFWRNIVDQLDQQVKGLDRGLTPPLTGDVVDHHPYSESRGIDPAYPNYIAWLSKTSFEEVRRGLTRTKDGKQEPVTSLLYMALRHSLLYEHAFLAMRLFKRFQVKPLTGLEYAWSDFAEKELYNLSFAFDTTYWDYIQMAPPTPWRLGPQSQSGSVLDLIQGRESLRALPDWKTHFGDIDETSRALDLFATSDFPTARLERLFAEHIDLASYRLDAWATGYVYQRLIAYRAWSTKTREGRISPLRPQSNPDHAPLRYDLNHRPIGSYTNGIFLGAYGWVENVMAGPAPDHVDDLAPVLAPQNGGSVTRDPDNFGFIHAPSLNHAVTAAVLRSASVTQPDTSAYNIDLSSARTRDALWIVEGVRNGQSPAALLGYRFERALRDRDVTLQQWLPQLRAAFPMPRQADTDPGAKEAIPAHDVVNGLLIIQARRDGTLAGKVRFAGGAAAAFADLADGILDTFDACGDLMLAESVHQAAQGNYARAGSVVTAAGEFTHVPTDFQVTQTPRSGTALSHRVLLAMDSPAPAGGLSSLRARLEPGLNQWLAALIGPLDRISSKLTYKFEGGKAEFAVTFDQLQLESIDLLYVTDGRTESDLNGRLDLIARPLFNAAHPDTPIAEIVIDTSGAAAAMALLDSARSLLSAARPATLRDFVAPSTLHGMDADAIDGIDEDELIERVLGVSRLDPGVRIASSLWATFEDVRARVKAAVEDPMVLLLGAAAFGIPEAVPGLQDPMKQLENLQPILDARHAAAVAKWIPFTAPTKDVLRICREVTEALLGGAFPLMPRVTLPSPLPVLPLLPDQLDDWLFQISTVREHARSLQDMRVLACELATPLAAIQVIQWPQTNKDWIALPTPGGAKLTGDLVSIAVQPMGPFDPTLAGTPVVSALLIDEWNETIPPTDETTGIAFHYDAPSAEPPQAVLLAVSQRLPMNNRHWTWDEVVACVDQALLVAKIRCVGPDELRATHLDPVLPATLAAESTYPATISTSWLGNTVSEVAHLHHDALKRT